MSVSHKPVMINEVMDALVPRDGAIYVDATFGAGGYSRALLEAADCTVWGIDRDPLAVEFGRDMAHEFGGRLSVVKGRFGQMREILSAVGVTQVDGIALDIGISSMQIDDFTRGFSFRADGPLDMRMDNGSDDPTAADIVNSMKEHDLANLIYDYGEERASRRIAREIVRLRKKGPIERTEQLARVIRHVVRRSNDGIDPATRTFQALRIYVNEELIELDQGLAAAEKLLRAESRLAVVSFHSLEDRRVKTFLLERSGQRPRPSRHMPDSRRSFYPTFRLVKRGAVKPKETEISLNARARSARLRWAERTAQRPIQVA
ncbi:MAG: 16S rRNA (cytosine(1402)-N(4))-methyltransferase [Rhodospirillaceae bacterium TMED8]|nr:16S rRNA (cytosine(1402)-N(4))-methyltransferase [Magnetovibrio sp.]OUT52293.1 MAG: 16S rRNA (cytosine(1402)-N(4))-methyltransferase [Rhodospirillaceae bacterium TMED8]